MRLFVCDLAVRKVVFIEDRGEQKGLEIKGRLISNDMYVKSGRCKIKLSNFEGVLLNTCISKLA